MSERATLKEVLDHFKNSALALLMPLIILGGIVFGIVTPTEAASIAVAYALVIGTFIYRNLTINALFQMIVRTSQISAVIYLIIGSASILGWWLSFNQIPQMIADMFIALSDNPNVILALIIALLLTVGMIMDINVMLVILAPIWCR